MHVLVHVKGYASPLDMFLKLEKITPKLVEEWRFGRVFYLERVLHGNLNQFRFILDTMARTAREMELEPSYTAYRSWGKGPKRPLRFSKSGTPYMEKRYSTHYVRKRKPEPGDQQASTRNDG